MSDPSNLLIKITRNNYTLNEVNEIEMIDKIELLVQQFEDTTKKHIEMIKIKYINYERIA